MVHLLSTEDQAFQAQLESCEFPIANFNHRAHLRLAYVYLAENDTEKSYELMRDALKKFIQHNGVDISKYHDTLTRAWFWPSVISWKKTENADSADSFIDQNPMMLDSKIMMTHYSAEVLFSDEARAKFVEPNIDPIPRYNE